MENIEIRHFHLFCGLGGGALGFNRGRAEHNGLRASFRCIGGVDVSPAAIRDFDRLAGVKGTVLDLFDREQYIAFHGREPGTDWREATPADIQAAAGGECPNIVFLSAPCKGFSGLLSESRSKSDKYQALNRLTLRGVWLMLEAWGDDPPELIIFENVPRIATRGRKLLDQIVSLLRHYGYATAETFHDCGEIGGLAQSRKRFLLVARHAEKVRPFLYEPPKRPLRGVGEILGKLPLPNDPAGGAMHMLPALQWKTWVRLAFVQAGSDWRSLNNLQVADGVLADYALIPDRDFNGGPYGVVPWASPVGTVTGMAAATRGAFSVADPRFAGSGDFSQYGVQSWEEPSCTVTSQRSPGQGTFAVADPRHYGPPKHNNEMRVVAYDAPARSVTGAHGSGHCVADPRPAAGPLFSKYAVTRWDSSTGTVIGGDDQGAYAVADPRIPKAHGKGADYLTQGNYGVVPWTHPTGSISAAASQDNGRWSVADPRCAALPHPNQKMLALIRSIDGTWHRPFTTLELAALQSLIDPEDIFDLDGDADGAKRERIGNAVPAGAAQAIADLMGHTLLLARSGESFTLSSMPIWVSPVAVALSVAVPTGKEIYGNV